MKLPLEFEKRMTTQLGENYPAFVSALQTDAPVSIRINNKKLEKAPEGLERVAWSETGYYLEKRPVFSSDPLWHNGSYYVQEASSMSIEKAFKSVRSSLGKGLKVLDLCAAPGGKSTHLACLLEVDDLLVSNEVIRARVPVLLENLSKNGYPNTIITNSDSADFVDSGPVFDLVLVDAPCSGEGLFRKDKDAINEWNQENVTTCELRQNRILSNIKHCIKTGGYLIYSTCTYNPGENQSQIDKLLQEGFEKATFEFNGKLVNEIQFMPHLYKGEGFFMGLLRKTEVDSPLERKNKDLIKPLKKDSAIDKYTLSEGVYFEHRKTIFKASEHVFEFYNKELFQLNMAQMGTPIGNLKDKLFQVSSFLPFSLDTDPSAFPTHELDQNQALSYLANQALITDVRDQKGYVLLKYRNQIIGLGKFAGNRINNLYPNEWKLRKIVSPDEFFNLQV